MDSLLVTINDKNGIGKLKPEEFVDIHVYLGILRIADLYIKIDLEGKPSIIIKGKPEFVDIQPYNEENAVWGFI